MAKFQVQGIEEYALKLSKFGENSNRIAGKAIYAAADIVANQIRENISNLNTVSNTYNINAYRNNSNAGITKKQKQGLLDGLGIAKMQEDNGYLNVKVGFDGYNAVATVKYPKGQPNQLIARVTENGSSFMDKQPFIRPAMNATKDKALAEMQRVIDEEAKKIMI